MSDTVEAVLNICANTIEVVGIILSLILLAKGLAALIKQQPGATKLIVLAIVALLTGMATPGALNWFIGSSRDTRCFTYNQEIKELPNTNHKLAYKWREHG